MEPAAPGAARTDGTGRGARTAVSARREASEPPPRTAGRRAGVRPGGGVATGAQTLDRGLRVLEALAERSGPTSLRDLARATGLHRSAIYRLLRVLATHRLVARDGDRGYRLDVGIVALAQRVEPGLAGLARPLLAHLAESVGATAFLTVADGAEAVAVAVVEPSHTAFHVAYRAGFRHPLTRGAPGIAILAGRPASSGELAAVAAARKRGYAVSTGEIQKGAIGLAAPVSVARESCRASVGIVTLGDLDELDVGRRVAATARELVARIARLRDGGLDAAANARRPASGAASRTLSRGSRPRRATPASRDGRPPAE